MRPGDPDARPGDPEGRPGGTAAASPSAPLPDGGVGAESPSAPPIATDRDIDVDSGRALVSTPSGDSGDSGEGGDSGGSGGSGDSGDSGDSGGSGGSGKGGRGAEPSVDVGRDVDGAGLRALLRGRDPGAGARGGLIAVVGATGTGKSELSLAIADQLAASGRRAEIVNADAMQLYRGMDIGTAKLAPDERRDIPHHLLDVLDVTDEASVAAYQREARATIDAILARDAVPILVGGSGLYVSSVLFDFRFPARDEAVRARLEADLEESGARALYDRLKAVDPAAAASIGQFNGRRLVRALEVTELTGEPLSGTLPDEPVPWRPATVLRLGMPRDQLVPRLDERVERMWRAGLVDEVAGLIPRGLRDSTTAARAIGYAQALAQYDGAQTREEAIAEAQALTRRYARRQVSWFRRYAAAVDIDPLASDPLAPLS